MSEQRFWHADMTEVRERAWAGCKTLVGNTAILGAMTWANIQSFLQCAVLVVTLGYTSWQWWSAWQRRQRVRGEQE